MRITDKCMSSGFDSNKLSLFKLDKRSNHVLSDATKDMTAREKDLQTQLNSVYTSLLVGGDEAQTYRTILGTV